MKPAMHGDTFSSYCQKVPDIYAWLSVRDVAKGFKVSPHNDYFDFGKQLSTKVESFIVTRYE